MMDQHYQRFHDMVTASTEWSDEDIATLNHIIETNHCLTSQQKILLEHLLHKNQPAYNVGSAQGYCVR